MSADDGVVHLADHRPKPTQEEDLSDWKVAATHMMAQNRELLAKISSQEGKIDRLLRGVEMLTSAMHDFRTGKTDGAYARVARHDEDPDLLRAKADFALEYPYTAAEIGEALKLNGSQVGLLLGDKGLKWAGNPDYQEMARYKVGRQRFWHKDIVVKLRDILWSREPDELGIVRKEIRAIFAAYKTRERQGTLPS